MSKEQKKEDRSKKIFIISELIICLAIVVFVAIKEIF